MKVLILNQAFYPDVVATAQYASDLALELTAAGHHVTAVCAARAYDDPSRRFPSHETWNGIEIYRVSGTGLGKSAKWRRTVDFAAFLVSCAARVISLPKFDLMIALTSPPVVSWVAAQLVPWKARRLAIWSMDLNPDEAIAAGWLREDSMPARILSAMMTSSLRRADRVIALDSFMAGRLAAKGVDATKIAVVPPWPQEQHVRFDAAGREEFRTAHGLRDKFVVMYSGNHSPCHPLDSLLEAAKQLESHRGIVFCFIGGGSEFRKIEAQSRRGGAPNILCLPYEPLAKLSGSLSAADLHVVVMGEPFVGIVHPCKIYNVMAIGSPVLYIGPRESHVADISSQFHLERWISSAQRGQVDEIVKQILYRKQAGATRPAYALPEDLSRRVLIGRLLRALETADISKPESAHVAA